MDLPVLVIILFLGIILLVDGGLIALTLWVSSRLNKMELPGRKKLFATAYLQILLGGFVTAALWFLKTGPEVGVGSGFAVVILSGILVVRVFLCSGWKQALQLWGAAAAMQLVILSVCSAVLGMGSFGLLLALFPPML